MKFISFLLLVITFQVAAQQSSTIKIGLFDPKVTQSGMILGYEGTSPIDERLEMGWSIDWFNKSYVDKRLAEQFNTNYASDIGELNELRAKTNLHGFLVLSVLKVNIPFDQRTQFYVIGNLGLDFLLVFYRDFNNPAEDDWQMAVDFGWRLGAGVKYKIGSRSDLFLEFNYHNSEPSWEYEVHEQATLTSPARTRVFERSYDMSGLMARLGIKYFY